MTMVRSNTDLSYNTDYTKVFWGLASTESGAVSYSGTFSYRSRIVLFVLCED